MEIDLQKEYESLKKRYPALPSFQEINVNFELSIFEPRIANTTLFARYLRKICSSYIENFCTFLTNLLHPNPNFLISAHESKFLSDTDKDLISKEVRENMMLIRFASSTTVLYDEPKEIEAIVKFNGQMKKNKEVLKTVFTKLNKGWEELHDKTEEKGSYVG